MEFKRYLKERLSQLGENEALNVTEITSEGKGIRKVQFNPQTARSLIPVPHHKKIVVNKNLKGLDIFLRLQGYDKEKVYQSLRKSKISSPRRDREVNPPPGSRVLNNPSTLYFYGSIYTDLGGDSYFKGYIFARGNDNKFYDVFYYDNGWYQSLIYNKFENNFLYPRQDYMAISDNTFKLHRYDNGYTVDIDLNLDLLGDNNYRQFKASGLTSAKVYDIWWFCKQLDGPSLNKVYIGNEVSSDVYNNCYKRGISQ